jgi:hypothetical protein
LHSINVIANGDLFILSMALSAWLTAGWSLFPQWFRTAPWKRSILSVENLLFRTKRRPLSNKYLMKSAVELDVNIIASRVSFVKHSCALLFLLFQSFNIRGISSSNKRSLAFWFRAFVGNVTLGYTHHGNCTISTKTPENQLLVPHFQNQFGLFTQTSQGCNQLGPKNVPCIGYLHPFKVSWITKSNLIMEKSSVASFHFNFRSISWFITFFIIWG